MSDLAAILAFFLFFMRQRILNNCGTVQYNINEGAGRQKQLQFMNFKYIINSFWRRDTLQYFSGGSLKSSNYLNGTKGY